MELKTYFAQDRNGNLIPSATVTIYLTGTNTLASGLTNVSNAPLSNPFTADADGKIQFHAPDGIYDMQAALGSTQGVKVTFQCVDVEQQLADANSAADRAETAAESVEGQAASIAANTREQWRRTLSDAGLNLVAGSFEEGATATTQTDAVWHMVGGQCYTWGGTLPKTVPENSTPASTGGIGASAWNSVNGSTLKTSLSKVTGAGQINTTSGESVQSEIDRLSGSEIKRVLNIAELRTVIPSFPGQRIQTLSAASSSVAEIPFGGGEFYARSITGAVDDGGYIIVPNSGSLVWVRLQTGKVMLDDFGAKADWSTDNAAAIRRALTFGKNQKTVIYCNAGTYLTSETVEIRKGTGLIGVSRTSTVIAKTTNNELLVQGSNGTADAHIDAFVAILGDIYDSADLTGASDMSWMQLKGITFRREGLTGPSNAVRYGIWAPKMNTSNLEDLRIECGYFGFWGQDIWSNTFTSVQFLGLSVGQYVGFQIDRLSGSVHALSGTSNVLTLVGVAGYEIGFQINSNQYTTLNSCTADGIRPMSGTSETFACPFFFINPHGITMNSCGSEGVAGERLRIVTDANAVYDCTVVVNAYQGQIVPENPAVSLPVFRVQDDGSKKLKVVMNACNFVKDPSHANQLAGYITGANASVSLSKCIYDTPLIVSGGATVTEQP